jgi:hypothetical protein
MSDKWWDMSDDELDDLFREASDKVDIPFDSSAFDKLRHKIDNQPKAESPRSSSRRWLLPLLALLLMVGVGVVYRYATTQDISQKETYTGDNKNAEYKDSPNLTEKSIPSINQNKQTNSPQKEIEASTKNAESSISKSERVSDTPLKTTKNNNSEGVVTPNKTVISKNTAPNATRLSVISDNSEKVSHNNQPKPTTENTSEKSLENNYPNPTDNPQKIVQNNEDNSIVKEANSADSQLINSKSSSSSLFAKNYKKQRRNQGTISKESSISNQIGQSFNGNSVTFDATTPETHTTESDARTNFFGVNTLANKNPKNEANPISVELPPFVDSLPRKIPSPKFSRFGVRLAFAPDINSIEYLETSALGSSMAFLLEYKLSRRFVLQTGLVYSNKKYGGEFDYYHSWTATWQKYHPSKPMEVDGGCKVLDIPLNIRFNAFQKPKQTWFVSAGISSYLMMNETYTYNYAWGATRTVDWADETSYYWSTLNLSIGLEKRLNKHFTLQAEPYLKTPLTGVGRGSVNLYSSGILFSTKYDF